MTLVAVVGTGLLGRGIAAVVGRAGHTVTLHDSSANSLSSALQQVSDVAGLPAGRLRAESSFEDAVFGADIVVEAIVEDLRLKQQVFERIGLINKTALIMSNSSVIPIGQIAARTAHPGRTVGTHWWNPPNLIPVVEVIRGPRTSESVMQRTTTFLRGLGKTPVRIERDVPGFVGNRLQHALWREALALVSEGVRGPEEVDRIVASTLGQSLAIRGPFAEMRLRGLETVKSEFRQMLPVINSEPGPARLLRENVSDGHLGAKSGRGFLSWPAGSRELAARRLQEHVERRLARQAIRQSAAALRAEDQTIALRLHIALWREALAMVDDEVSDEATIDLMALNTIGLRLAAMGPVENADYVGLDLTLAIHEAILPSLQSSLELPRHLERLE